MITSAYFQVEGAGDDIPPHPVQDSTHSMVAEKSTSEGSQAEKLALRMMEGWTLTAQHCPRWEPPSHIDLPIRVLDLYPETIESWFPAWFSFHSFATKN